MKTGNQIFANYLETRYSSKSWRINKLGQDTGISFDEADKPDTINYTPDQDKTKPNNKTESAVNEILSICNNIDVLKRSMETHLSNFNASNKDKDLVSDKQLNIIKRLQSFMDILKSQASYNGNLFKLPAIAAVCEKIGDIEYVMKNIYAAVIKVDRSDIELSAKTIESNLTKILKDCQIINSKTSNILSPY